MNMIKIDQHEIRQYGRPFIIGEVAQAHDGSLGMAHAYIDLAARSGVDAVKFQTHIASAESTKDEPFRVRFSRQDETRYDYWKRMEFTPEQWGGLADHAREKGLIFLSSAFSIEAVNLLESIGMPAWKIGSGEFRSKEMIDTMVKTGKPILLSTGMSRYAEINHAAMWLMEKETPFALLQCTSKYPTPLEEAGLNIIHELHQLHGCPTGLSDHSGTVYPAIAAMAQGAAIIEVHMTFDRGMFGPDVTSSLTPAELELICKARDSFYTMSCNPVNKDILADSLETMRGLFTKSIAPAKYLKAGTVLDDTMMVPRKPGTGIPYAEKEQLIGVRLTRDVSPDRILQWDDLENSEDIKKRGQS